MTIATCDEQFRVEWTDPADALFNWNWDKMHHPRPAAPLTAHMMGRMDAMFNNTRSVVLNGYQYRLRSLPPAPPAEVIERGAVDIWQNDYIHRVRKFSEQVRAADYESLSASELAGKLDAIFDSGVAAFRYTMVVVYGFMGPTMQFVDLAEKELGADGGQLVARLLQGFKNQSADAGAGLGELAQEASKSPAVAAAIRDGQYADLDTVAGGGQFMGKFRRYLEQYGWRAESWGLAHVPTWAEDQTVPLTLIGQYLRDSGGLAAAMDHSVQQREDAEREVERRLSGEKLAEFKVMLDVCRPHVSVSESRAQWQLTIIGSQRVPVLVLGRKLAAAGVVDEPNDVFFLRLAELEDAAAKPAPMQAIVGERKADLARWEKVSPPPFIGAAPAEGPPEIAALLNRFLGLGVIPSTEENIVKGNPANAGIVRGRARVIRELREAGRLQKGEILVCPSTAPPWTPLFAIAAAVVTDTGGILSHSAICAREYGLPCIVGTLTATNQIPDGAMITVDGGAGTVRIDGL